MRRETDAGEKRRGEKEGRREREKGEGKGGV